MIPTALNTRPEIFISYEHFKKEVTVEQFATEANVEQAVTYWLHTLDTTSFHARNTSRSVRVGQMLKCQW